MLIVFLQAGKYKITAASLGKTYRGSWFGKGVKHSAGEREGVRGVIIFFLRGRGIQTRRREKEVIGRV